MRYCFVNGNQVSEPYFDMRVLLNNNFVIYKITKTVAGLNAYHYKNIKTGDIAIEIEQ